MASGLSSAVPRSCGLEAQEVSFSKRITRRLDMKRNRGREKQAKRVELGGLIVLSALLVVLICVKYGDT